jgi:hypothetical protein
MLGRTLLYNTLELNCNSEVHPVRPSDGEARVKLVTRACTISCNVMLQDTARHTRTLPLLADQ